MPRLVGRGKKDRRRSATPEVFRRRILAGAAPLLFACGGDQATVPLEPSVVVSPDAAFLVGVRRTVALHADVVGGGAVMWA